MKASSPLPSPNFCLATSHYLLRQSAISQGTRRGGIIVQNSLPEAGRFTQTNVAADDSLKCLLWKMVAYLAHDITCQPRARIKHREHNAHDEKRGIEFTFDDINSIEQLS